MRVITRCWRGLSLLHFAVGAMLWALVIPRFSTLKRAYWVSLLLGAAGFASVYFLHDQYMLFVSFILIGVAWGAILALPFTFVTNALKDHIGTYLGLFNCAICLPQIVAAATGGVILKCLGGSQAAMMLVAAVLLVLAAASTSLVKEK